MARHAGDVLHEALRQTIKSCERRIILICSEREDELLTEIKRQQQQISLMAAENRRLVELQAKHDTETHSPSKRAPTPPTPRSTAASPRRQPEKPPDTRRCEEPEIEMDACGDIQAGTLDTSAATAEQLTPPASCSATPRTGRSVTPPSRRSHTPRGGVHAIDGITPAAPPPPEFAPGHTPPCNPQPLGPKLIFDDDGSSGALLEPPPAEPPRRDVPGAGGPPVTPGKSRSPSAARGKPSPRPGQSRSPIGARVRSHAPKGNPPKDTPPKATPPSTGQFQWGSCEDDDTAQHVSCAAPRPDGKWFPQIMGILPWAPRTMDQI